MSKFVTFIGWMFFSITVLGVLNNISLWLTDGSFSLLQLLIRPLSAVIKSEGMGFIVVFGLGALLKVSGFFAILFLSIAGFYAQDKRLRTIRWSMAGLALLLGFVSGPMLL